jgi:short-subunit dehydrogenase
MGDSRGRTVVVTGASRGIGAASPAAPEAAASRTVARAHAARPDNVGRRARADLRARRGNRKVMFLDPE